MRLRGRQGFQRGGAIKLAQSHAGISPGEIASLVESGTSNYTHTYTPWQGEAERTLDAMGGGVGDDLLDDEGTTSYTKSYRFRRDKGENAWDCTGRLAEEVDKLRFITMPRRGSDVFIYCAGQDLWKLPVQARFSPTHPAVTSPLDYDLDYRKTARVLSIELIPDALTQPLMWGFPVQIADAGDPTSGETAGDDTATGAVLAKAKAISARNLPYSLGGGHAAGWDQTERAGALDCSSSTSVALHAGGLMDEVSSWFLTWGDGGEGERMTVWVRPGIGGDGHVFIEFKIPSSKVHYFDTSQQAGGPPGPHVRYGRRGTAGMVPRHWPGT